MDDLPSLGIEGRRGIAAFVVCCVLFQKRMGEEALTSDRAKQTSRNWQQGVSRLVERIPNSVSRLRSAVDWLQVLQLRPRRNSPQQLSNMRRQEEAAFLLFSILCEFFSSAVKPLSLRG